MAKQLINVGSQANDGTGDSIRSGAQKVNSSINELYNSLGEDGINLSIDINSVISGNVLRSNGSQFVSAKLSYNDLSNLPTIPAAQVQSDWAATSGPSYILNKPALFSGVYDDLIDKPTLSNVSITGNYNDLTNRPVLSTVATSGSYTDLLFKPSLFSGSWNDLTNKPTALSPAPFSDVAFSGDYNDLSNLPNLETGALTLDELDDVVVTAPSSGQVLKYNGSNFVNGQLSYNDLSNTPTTLAPSRGTISATSSSLANNASQNIDVTGFKSYLLMKISTNRAAWVTVYTDQTSRINDASRSETTDPYPGSGVIAEVITNGNQTVLLTPGTLGFNNDNVPSGTIYLKVKNLSGSTGTVEVTLTLLQLEL